MAFSGMGKTGGDKMRAVGQAGSVEGRKTTMRETGKAGGQKALERETERLRSELATEKQRTKELEETSSRVAERLDAAIESVKAILARQG